MLVGTALAVIIPEGIRALYDDGMSSAGESGAHEHVTDKSHSHETHSQEHSFTIGVSLVLGFVFMMLVDQISSRRSEGVAPDKNLTATIGLVVHAAGILIFIYKYHSYYNKLLDYIFQYYIVHLQLTESHLVQLLQQVITMLK